MYLMYQNGRKNRKEKQNTTKGIAYGLGKHENLRENRFGLRCKRKTPKINCKKWNDIPEVFKR